MLTPQQKRDIDAVMHAEPDQIMNPHIQLAIKAVYQMMGDDLQRAQMAFRGKSEKQMQGQWGDSGKTCAQVLAEWEEHHRECRATIAYLKSLC